jgi:hypothetical protein
MISINEMTFGERKGVRISCPNALAIEKQMPEYYGACSLIQKIGGTK